MLVLWNEIFSALHSISKQAFFKCKFISPGENKARYLEAISYFFPSATSLRIWGLCEAVICHICLSYSKQGVNMWTRKEAWPQIARCIWKKQFQQARTLVPFHAFSSVAQSCPTLCDPVNRSMPGLPVHHQLPEFTQTHVHRVGDAIQPSHPLSFPSPSAPSPSQHQGLFQWVSFSCEVAKVLEFQLQHLSFQWTPRTDLLSDRLVGSPCSPRDSQESSPTPQLKSINSSTLSFLYSPTLTSIHDHWKNHSL